MIGLPALHTQVLGHSASRWCTCIVMISADFLRSINLQYIPNHFQVVSSFYGNFKLHCGPSIP